ncbi:ATP-binding protein [Streptosporangium sp. V21-05]|uniref:ATP-binding protein n=1 Tax=Streptosporangium sp. V21-05 TaxID=3446115 RepID=UPI003F534184
MTARLLSVLVGVFADRFRPSTSALNESAHPATPWSPHLDRIPGWSTFPGPTPVISQRFPATRDQVRLARNFVAEILGGDHPLRDDAMLLTSELATNAVEHSNTPLEDRPSDPEPSDAEPSDRPREFVVTVAFLPHGVIITVQDTGSTQIPRTRNSGLDATGGRGLVLVNDLAARWGFHRDPTGTVIWFELS